MKPGMALGASKWIVHLRFLSLACLCFFFTSSSTAQGTGSFVSTGNLNTVRVFQTSTLLNNGTVLITGGGDVNGNLLASAEIYNPATGTFAFTGSLNTPRNLHTATLLNNGMVLIVAGEDSNGNPVASAELYNPATGTFTSTGSLNIARDFHTATLLNNGMVLIAGGTDPYAPLASAELYNPATGTFTLTGNLTMARELPLATLLNNGMVLIVGGLDSDGDVLRSAELYDPAAGTFALTGNPNAGHLQGAATLLNNGMVLLEAGYDPDGVVLASAELYDPSTATFTLTGSLSTELNQQSATLLSNGMVLIAGGFDSQGTSSSASLYNSATGTFIPTGSLNTARADQTTTLLNNGMVLIAGGDNDSGGMASAELYEPSTLTPPNLVSISLSPGAPTLAVGGVQRFVATGTFSDSSTQTLASVTWSSANSGVATITNDVTNLGAAYAVGGGSTTIQACAGSLCGSTVLTVPGTPVSLVSIAVTPANPSILNGTTEQFMATGTYSDNSTQNLTNSATWSSSTTAVATINGSGLATADAAGSTAIQASSGNISGSTLLTVTAPVVTLQTITVTPANASIALSGTQQYTAMGTYSDLSTQDLTSVSTWNSSNTTVASVSAGLAVGTGPGSASITATYSGVVSNGASLIVLAPPPTSVTLSTNSLTFPAQGLNVASNSGQSYTSPGPGANAIASVSGDFNGDGKLDIAVANGSSNSVSVMLGNGDGTFQTPVIYTVGNFPDAIVAADFNKDGKLDLAVADQNSGDVAILMGNGDGSFQAPVIYPGVATPLSINVGDFNGDGFPDLVAGYQNCTVLLNQGNGTFVKDTGASIAGGALTIAVGDFNGDGKTDIAVGGNLYLGNGDGTFTNVPLGFSGIGVASGDLNGDGKLDLVFFTRRPPPNNLGVALGNGDGTFQAPVYYSIDPFAFSIVVADINGDGKADVVTAHDVSGSFDVLLGNGDGTLQNTVSYESPGEFTDSLSLGDFNGDGKLDLIIPGGSVAFIPGNGDGTFRSALNVFVTDTGSANLNVSGVTITGTDASSFHVSGNTCSGFAWLPSESCRIGVTFQPTSLGPKSAQLQITDNVNGSPQIVALGGSGVAPIVSLSQTSISFGSQLLATTSGPTNILLSNVGAVPLNISSIAVTGANGGDFAQTNSCGSSIAAGASCTLLVSFTPSSVGTRAAGITITDDAAGGMQSVALSGTGVAPLPAATLSLSSLLFGDQLVGTTSTTQGVVLTNTGSAPLLISSIAASGNFGQTNNCGASIASGANCTISVNFTPLAAGLLTGAIAIVDNAAGSPQTVSLSGTGIVLVSVAVTPLNASIPLSATQQFAAMGTYSDSSTQDLTSSVTWSSTAATIASINATGLATAVGLGQTTIQAALSAVAGSAALTITPGFVMTGGLSTGRGSHTSTLLNNGMVLIAGGGNSRGSLASAELYSPATGTFVATGSLNAARDQHTATLLNNGMVLIVGGFGSGGPIASAELYNPATGAFTPTGTLNTARDQHTATLLNNGMVLIAGGFGPAGALFTAELYNPATGQFTPTGNMNTDRFRHTASLLNNGFVLVAGGYSYNAGTPLAEAELYNPATGLFIATGSLNFEHYSHTAILLNDGTLLIAGGYGDGLQPIAELYNPATGTFSLTGNLNSARFSHSATLLNDGVVLIAGGYVSTANPELSTPTASAELYNPVTGTFTPTGSMNAMRGLDTATLLVSGMVLIAGGDDTNGSALATAETYEPGALTPPNLVSISLSPNNSTLPLGAIQRFTAIGTFSDSSTQTLASVTWNSTNNSVATITDDESNLGAVFALTQGSTAISACTGSICGTIPLTVGPAALLSLAIAPINPSTPLGLAQEFSATGTYTDGSTQDLTSSATWSSSAPTVSTVTAGLASALSQGSATITATSGTANASTTLTVGPPQIASNAIIPANPSLALGQTVQLNAISVYTDGSTQPFTGPLRWESSDTTVATVDANGLASTLGQGSVSITVLYLAGSQYRPVASTALTVGPPLLLSLVVAPASPSLLPGATEQFTATATYTNGTTDVTSAVAWTSSQPLVGTISNAAGTQGLTSSVATGLTTITATLGAMSPSTTLTVNFATTGSLNTARYLHTATLLNNGMVLVAGGSDINGNPMASAELYNPATGSFTPTGSLNNARYFQTSTMLNNGMVLTVGGYGGSANTVLANAELYNPATGTFTPTGSLNNARYNHTATLLKNGMVLIAGGYGGSLGVLSSAELYNPATGTFTTTGSMNSARYFQSATLLNNGQVLVAGGYSANSLTTAELYNPASGTFASTGSLNNTRYLHTATLLNNGMVLIAGGYGTNAGVLASAELYNPATGMFTSTGSLNNARYFQSATVLSNGQVLFAGGFDDSYLASAELYDSSSGSFSITGSLNTARYGQTATSLKNGQVLIGGGNNGAAVASGELYVPPTLNLPNLASISVSPATPVVLSGTSQAFVATGTFNDGSTQTLQSVTWSSSNQAVATISNDVTNLGTAITLSGGTTTISACNGAVCGTAALTAGVPIASLSTGSLTFANQNVGTSSAAQVVTLTNTGTGALTITALAITGANPGDFIQTNNCPISPTTLSAGANCMISVKFDPTATGSRTANISITDNAPGSPQNVSLSSTGTLPSITLTPATLAFGNQVISTTSVAKTITLSNPGSGALTISSIAITGANLTEFSETNTCGTSVGPSGTCSIFVTFTPATAAAKTASVTVTDNSAGSPHSVSLTGTGILPFTATPNSLAFGNQGVNSTSAAKNVTLTNNTSAAVTLSSSTISGTNAADFAKSATTCGASLASKTTCTISITFTPSTSAAESGTLTITDSAANSPQTVSLTGTGVAQATTSVATLAFGNQGIANTSAAKTVTLTNNDSAAITLSGNIISGTNASAFAVSATTCGTSLAGHASCAISVTFTPATTGAMTATLSIADTASNSPQTVNLTGTGVQPVTLSAATLAFGNQGIVSTSAAKTVTVTNNNSVGLTLSSIAIAPTPGDFVQSATTCGTSIAAHSSCTVSVTYDPSVLGAETATLTLTDTAGNSPQSVGLTGTGVAQFTLSAASITFANQAFGTTSTAKNVTLTNNTSSSVVLSSIGMGGSNPGNFTQSATTCGASLNGHSSCSISFTFSPSAAASYSAIDSISDGASNSPQSISLTGTGILPVSVTPASLAYANQTVGTTSAAKTVTIKNNLPGTLTGLVFSFTGTNSGDFLQSATTCGTSLPTGASCTLSVEFKPSATGGRSALLSVSDSATTSPQSVSLSGTGK